MRLSDLHSLLPDPTPSLSLSDLGIRHVNDARFVVASFLT